MQQQKSKTGKPIFCNYIIHVRYTCTLFFPQLFSLGGGGDPRAPPSFLDLYQSLRVDTTSHNALNKGHINTINIHLQYSSCRILENLQSGSLPCS